MKVTGERSPGDKGTLDIYLKPSPNDKNTINSGLQARQKAFTKKLDLEVSGPSAGLTTETSKGVERCLSQSGSQVLDKEAVATAETHATDDLLCSNEKDNSELRDFATGFLSLYCR